MKVAIVGAGVTGLVAAWHLHREHEVTVFEAAARLGGHANTVDALTPTGSVAVDTGFIVFNRPHYPTLCSLFDELGIAIEHSNMSFGVSDPDTGICYNAGPATGLLGLRNATRPDFWSMLRGLPAFYRLARRELAAGGPPLDQTLDDFIAAHGLSDSFVRLHLLPMASALWSAPMATMRQMPARLLLAFFDNHAMLQLFGRPDWLTVSGGSQQYVKAIVAKLDATIHQSAPVAAIKRTHPGVALQCGGQWQSFDHVIVTCAADIALALLESPLAAERDVLSAFKYQDNNVCLHSDARWLPPAGKRAAWFVHLPQQAESDQALVTYNMAVLQNLRCQQPMLVSLNAGNRVDPKTIHYATRYRHPIFGPDALQMQAQAPNLQGLDGISYAGAYLGFGFHEDGARSGKSAALALSN